MPMLALLLTILAALGIRLVLERLATERLSAVQDRARAVPFPPLGL